MRMILLVLSALSGLAQEVRVIPKWKSGDVLKLEYQRTREDSRRPESNGVSKTPIELHILNADAKGYDARWKSGKTEFPAGMQIPPEVLMVQQKALDLYVDFRLNRSGEFTEVSNREDIVGKLEAMLEDMSRSGGVDMKTVRALLNADTLVEAASQDARIYFGIYGVALRPQEKVSVRIQQPFPLSPSVTLPATLTIELVAVEGNLARFRSTTDFEPDGLKSAMNGVFTRAGMKQEAIEKMPPLVIRDENRYLYAIDTGLMREVVAERSIEMGAGIKRRDRRELRLQ